MNLIDLGWNKNFESEFNQFNDKGRYQVARVAVEYKGIYKLYTEHGEVLGEITGKMRYNEEFPAVGDWVVVSLQGLEERAVIYHILPRKSKFSRNMAGTKNGEQIVAANIDTVFIVTSLNQDFNLRRIERYLTIAWDSGANPVVILSKADLCEDIREKKSQVESVAFGVPIHVISSIDNQGIDGLRQYLQKGKTVALLGSSGVGKSTLINNLLGKDKMKVNEIREDDGKGKHTTTHRELILLEEGGVIIDTPGMREIQLWDNSEGLKGSFSDIEELARSCKFNNCQHDSEPGCAVKKAIEQGELPEERLESYRKLERELLYIERKRKYGAERAAKLMQKDIFGF
ncbi:ribosome small subunit-dependent GTPase A [Orenia metallireducens]|uniref:Small ribosomal subunit biogenesis GTPase RsgA n=1 Tax=Orenia metallireducens TaxID=1413210 RepID=A0A1C0ABN9_9FIRM|nr:ribosome small subunit-dependent GTPase A [Orenia metallireducens]OCL27799.1 ribosome small subunit-dependent GTPase A [Orenia metallireducens]